MATIFLDCKHFLLIDFKLHILIRNIRHKRRKIRLISGVRLLHDNAAVHTAGIMKAVRLLI